MPSTSSSRPDLRPSPSEPKEGYGSYEAELAAAFAAGARPSELAARIEAIYRPIDRRLLTGASSLSGRSVDAGDYLSARKGLNRFAIESLVKYAFLGSLKPELADKLFVFGLGRLFSSYNDLGAQHSTDVDINVITEDGVTKRALDEIWTGLERLRHDCHARFGAALELHRDYTVQRLSAVDAKLKDADPTNRLATALFYRSNEASIRIFKDHPSIRDAVFSQVRPLPDAALFEHFLGLSSGKPSFAKLRSDAEPLIISLDGSCDRLAVSHVLGSRSFGLWLRRHFPQGLFIAPPEWFFSMKYMVNRVYDYVCAMRSLGHELSAVGLGKPGRPAGVDPDFEYLRAAHGLMLYLQELIQTSIGAFGIEVDFGWISGSRFHRLVELGGEGFIANFETMALEGGLLRPSEAERYRRLKTKILTRSGDRVLEGPIAGLKKLPEGLRYETIFMDGARYRIRIPYTWSDLAFFVFSAISVRMAQIVEGRILPTLPSLGMPRPEYARYRKALGVGA